MSIVVPGVATNYPSPLIALRSPFGADPKEGRYQIPVEVDWGSMGGADYNVSFNLQNSGNTKEISQICAVHWDNSACGADTQMVFTDTSETVTIPAYEPYALVPIFSRSLQFFVIAGIDSEVVESNDVSRFTLFNFAPPPVTIPPAQEQDLASVGGVDMGTASTAVIAAGINGTIQNVELNLAVNATNSGNGTWKLVDGASNVVAQGSVSVSSGTKYNVTLFSQSDMRVRFTNGLNLVCTETAVLGATINANVYFRTP